MNRSQRVFMKLLSVFFLLLIVGGCGGSTQGTGGVAIEGKVLRTDGSAIGDLIVTVLQTGDSGTTDQNGDFSIATSDEVSEASLLIEGGSLSTQVELGQIPTTASAVRVSIEVEEEANSGEVTEIEISESSSSSSGSGGSSSGSGSSDSGSDSDDDDDSSDPIDDSESGSNSGSGSSDDDDDSDDSDSFSGSDDDDDDDNSGSGNSGSGSENSGSGDDDDDDPEEPEEEESTCEDEDVEGVITSLGSSSITVSGITYSVTSETEIEDENGEEISLGNLAVGVTVRVRGECESEVLVAKDIRIED